MSIGDVSIQGGDINGYKQDIVGKGRWGFQSSLSSICYTLSMETTRAFQLEYSRIVSFHFSRALSLLHVISLAYLHLIPSLHATLLSALWALDRYSATHLRKLSDLCVSFLWRGGSFPFNPLPPTPRPPPLFADCPFLASILGLPAPPHIPATLPPNFNPPLPTPIPIPPTRSLTSIHNLSLFPKPLSYPKVSPFPRNPILIISAWLLMLPPLPEASAGNTFGPSTPILHTTPALSIPASPSSVNPPKLPFSHPLEL